MSEDICQLCFEKSDKIKYIFSKEDDGLQEILQKFCAFLFQDGDYIVGQVCVDCWKTLQQFHQFCEKIRTVQESYADTGKESIEVEYVDDENDGNVEELSADESNTLSSLTIEQDIDSNSSLARRQLPLTSNVVKALEKQLKFEEVYYQFDDIDFEKVSRFMDMKCTICNDKFSSFHGAHRHYFDKHKRSAAWTCCKIDLETPYDILDHLKYHESNDDFKCAACKKLFLTSNKLKYHIRRNHLPVEHEAHICLVCKKDCKTQRLLINHQKNHINFDCPFCEKIISAASYEPHVRHHTTANNGKRSGGSNNKEVPSKKQKSKSSPATKKGDSGEKVDTKTKITPKKDTKTRAKQTKKCTLSIAKNENGLYECDMCKMEFDKMSRVFIHRNKVHV